MASEIRVNKIENRSGLGTVTFADTGVDLAGIVTATTFSGSGASLTSLPAAQLTGTLPAISGANLTGVASTENIRTNTNATFLQNINVSGTVTATSYGGSGASLTSIPAANIVGVATAGFERTGGFGKILQVVQSVKTDTASWTGTSFTDIAGTDETGAGSIWEVNITPTKANSKILVEFSAAMGSNLGVMMAVRLVREIQDSSAAYPFLGDASGSSPRVSRQVRDDQTAMKTHAISQAHFSYLDSPSYTLGNKITYHLEGMGYSGSETVYINRSGSQQTESTYDGLQASTITVMEVAT